MNYQKTIIERATDIDFENVKKYIKQFELDDRNLIKQQFLVAKQKEKLVGFGRILKHNGCDEFCSLGVIEAKRCQGIARQLIEHKIKISTQPIYLVCIIPEYFMKLGFIIVKDYPKEMQLKLDYCTSVLVVPENYVVLHYPKK